MRPQCYGVNREMAWAIVVFILINVAPSATGQACGGTLTGSGSFSSPNYPGSYPNNIQCEWILIATPDLAVKFQLSSLAIQTHSDVLQVYSEDILVIQYEFSSSSATAVLGGRVKVVFKTDSSGQAAGFSMSFSSAAPSCGVLCNTIFCVMWTPNFPGLYPRFSACNWRITTSTGTYLGVDFTTVASVPLYGQLQLSSTTQGAVTTNSTFTNSVPLPMVLGDSVSPSFSSIGCRRGTGFLATARVVLSNTCQTSLSDQGSLTTPGYPNGYPPYSACIYQLTASPGLQVSLAFSTLDVEALFDSVRLYSQGSFVGSYSGTYAPFTVVLPSPVTLEFVSDHTGSARGVAASFTSV